ncbi:uncharacterized protein LOC113904375 [Bos indicus x Bos taurus]|nr:uncharacterized protein LOC613677 [Bos taurus]XP_019828693.1 PREDICTED: uncharacterized protein LOC109567993 [Bos indicus]XP_020749050.1 uncharacterized protein LOC110137156 [Odocoileus virginianus texanus]XP_027417241.1 uncharacterized protein LOC113904375 [Bos indicus x Bos taurus]XP_027417251.1 uncharacterized protein LOC113904375 [Bos indicus x Bos taurus]CAI9156036.1 unnamed protein product [Rangifer tarandus platyrhynchus]CAI9693301.1 unnamed protein product [Rangifer tarandus platyr
MQTVTQGPLTLSLPSTLGPHAPHLLSPVLEALRKTWKFWPEMVRRKSMKKPRSVGEKKVEAKKQLPEQTVQNLAKSVWRQDRYSCGAGERETLKHAPPIFVGRDN